MEKKILIILFIICSIYENTYTQPVNTIQEESSRTKVTVGIKISPPFTMKNKNGNYTGVSVDLWKLIAEELGLEYSFKEYNLVDLLNAIRTGEVDICISPLTVTSERLQQFEFTQPFFTSNLTIAAHKQKENEILLLIRNFFSKGFLKALLSLFVVILIFGFLIWIIERKHNPTNFGKGIRGIGHGIWWSAVTMTTVGYGSKVPKTVGGRIVATIWMFTAIIIISSLTGSVAASLTTHKNSISISKVSDLRNKRVGSVKGSNCANILLSGQINFEHFDTIQQALTEVTNGKLDAFFYDEPIIRYLVQNSELAYDIELIPQSFNSQYYSFSLPDNHILFDTINVTLIKKLESINWKTILNDYRVNQ